MAGASFFSNTRARLRAFDRAAGTFRAVIGERHGEELAGAVVPEMRAHFEELLPELEDPGSRAPQLRIFLNDGALHLAFYLAMKQRGFSAAEAWGVSRVVIERRLAKIPSFLRRVAGTMFFSRFVKQRVRLLADRSQRLALGGFRFDFVEGDGKEFDYGVDYTECGIQFLMRRHGAEEFGAYLCMGDIAASEMLGWGLRRTQTLSHGGQRCDFRFRKGGETQVSGGMPHESSGS